MGRFNSTLVQNERLLPGIHGLRGVAALAVVLFHLVHVGGVSPPNLFAFIDRDFGYGVHLFFILSAFSLMHSTELRTNSPHWLVNYFTKRFFRIAPLFYLMLSLWVAVGVMKGVDVADAARLLLNMTFTFGFVPPSGIVWGGWSIGVEMMFYAVFPVLLLLVKTHRATFLLLIMTVVASTAARTALHAQELTTGAASQFDWCYFSFLPNMCFFAMGLYAYVVVKRFKGRALLRIYVPIFATLAVGGLLLSDLGPRLYSSARPDIVLWGIGLSALCAWQAHQPSPVIANRVGHYLGERSYSIYLLHPVVLALLKGQLLKVYEWTSPVLGSYAFFLCAGLLMVGLLVCGEFTYRAIELPGIQLGRRWIAARESSTIVPPIHLGEHEHRHASQVRICG